MTVRELLEKLVSVPDDAQVFVCDQGSPPPVTAGMAVQGIMHDHRSDPKRPAAVYLMVETLAGHESRYMDDGSRIMNDCGWIELPDEHGCICRRDKGGNLTESREPSNPGHHEWLDLFEDGPHTIWECPQCHAWQCVHKDGLVEAGEPLCLDCPEGPPFEVKMEHRV